MRFEFATATRILYGRDTLKEVPAIARTFGARALLVTGGNGQRALAFQQSLSAEGLVCHPFSVAGEPTISDAEIGANLARAERIDLVISIGGGSAIDCGKAIAALATNDGPALDYLEVIGRGVPLKHPPLPFIAIPTTAGTGAEVTRNAVLASAEHRVKASLRHPLMLPRLAVVDPTLTIGLPPTLTASTGMDALTQLIEPFLSCRANAMTDALCREALPKAAHSLLRAFAQPDDLVAREEMSLAALFSGLALANAGLGAVHGFAAPIGGMFDAPHGAVCAALLPAVLEVNLRALRQRQPQTATLQRFGELARLLTGLPGATADDAIVWTRDLRTELQIPPLRTYGLTLADVPVLCEKAAAASSMKGNPVVLETTDLWDILERSL
jgi:alcohol dehydrogenase class IV